MKFWKNKRKILTVTAVLLCFMLVCTLISKSVYAYSLPQITVAEGQNRALGRQIRIYGAVAQSREYAVSTIPAVRVDTVEVGRGDEVEAGELLFTLDMEDLKEQIARRELAIKKLEVQISTLQYNQGLADEERVKDTNRLLEDYLDIAADNEIAVERARIRESEALQDLEKHQENMVQVTDSEGRAAAWEEYEAWKEYGEFLQEEVERLTAELDAAQQKVERAQAELDEAKHMAGVFFSSESVSMAEDGSAAVPDAKEAEPEAAGEAADIQSCAEETEGVNQPGEGDSAGETGTAELSEETETSGETGAAELPGETEASGETGTAELPGETEASGETGTEELPGETEASGETGTEELPGETETSGEAGGTGSETAPEGQNPELTELQECLEEAIAARDACAAALENARRNLQEHQSEWKAEPDFTAEDAAQRSWEDQEETLRRNAESADWAYQDAQRQMERALSEAQREVDDSVEPEELQDTLTLNQMELSFLKKELNQYQKLQEQEGKVSAVANGIITAVNVTAGNDTPDGAAVIYADKEDGLEFHMTLTKEELKYVNLGTEGSLQIGMTQENCTVEQLEQQSDGNYLAVIPLQTGTGSIGAVGYFSTFWQSEIYQCCVLADAVYEENLRKYIYVVRRQKGILGEELVAEKRFVTVQEEGDNLTALGDLDLTEGEELIVSSTKELTDGAVVRYRLSDEGNAE